jgi:CRP-like cAMP-binding protein
MEAVALLKPMRTAVTSDQDQGENSMAVGAMQVPQTTSLWDDPLGVLPRRKPQIFQKDQTVFAPEDAAESLFLVVDGVIKLSRIAQSGRETVLDFCCRDTFFGESCLLGASYRGQLAVALEDSTVMEWTIDDLDQLMRRHPELAPSLLRVLARKVRDADARIESLAIDQIAHRLLKVLMMLGDRFGESRGNGVVHVLPVTHELLAKYVGTSREIITQHMSQMRRKGLLRYSRSGMEFDPVQLQRALSDA